MVSREAAFLVNNWILLFCAFFVLFATMFPTLSEAVTGERLTIAAPFFNKWMAPIGLILLFLTGVGPLLVAPSTLINLQNQFLFPVSCGLVAGAAVVALGVASGAPDCASRSPGSCSGPSLKVPCAAPGPARATGSDIVTALITSWRGRTDDRGGCIVHVGIVLIFLGFAGESFKKRSKRS